MELSTNALVVIGIMAIVVIVCTFVLYPELRDLVKELKKYS